MQLDDPQLLDHVFKSARMQPKTPTKSKMMKKSKSALFNENDVNNDKNTKKPKHLINFVFTYHVEKIRGKKLTRAKCEGVVDQNLRYDRCGKSYFRNSLGLGDYQVSCKS